MTEHNGGPPPASQPVLIVSTPAAKAAAERLLPQYKTLFDIGTVDPRIEDWLECLSQDVAIWPANTPQSIARAEHLAHVLAEMCPRVRLIRPNGTTPAGWDIADGKTMPELLVYARTHAELIEFDPSYGQSLAEIEPGDSAPPWGADEVDSTGLGDAPYTESGTPQRTRTFHVDKPTAVPAGTSCIELWARWGLERRSNGEPYANLSNACKCLRNDVRTGGRIWFDSFHQRVFTDMPNGERLVARREWTSDDDLRLTDYLQTIIGLVKLTSNQVSEAVRKMATEDTRNEPTDWLDGLIWDQEPRLEHLVSEGFGAEHNEYTQAVGRCWLVGMVARILRPGCQVDSLPVFESPEGARKTSALALIGGAWFAECHESIMSKDFFQLLQGKMLIEISELHTFKRADIDRIKGVITCRMDRYRASYGRYAEDHPRSCVFSATTNRSDWNASDTGARRFWPVTCGEISLEWLATNRSQLFAEAVSRYRSNESWWDVPRGAAQAEQDARIDRDVWERLVLAYASAFNETTVADILRFAIEKKPADTNRGDQMRITSILQINGWRLLKTKRSGEDVRLWRNPKPATQSQRLPQDEQRRPQDDDAAWR